jgi:hypothetical protein
MLWKRPVEIGDFMGTCNCFATVGQPLVEFNRHADTLKKVNGPQQSAVFVYTAEFRIRTWCFANWRYPQSAAAFVIAFRFHSSQ